MKAVVITEIMEGVSGLDASEGAKRQFIELVSQVGARHGVKTVLRAVRVESARRMLELNVSRPTIRDRLIANYGVSERQAYREIADAMQLCQKPPVFGKCLANNAGN